MPEVVHPSKNCTVPRFLIFGDMNIPEGSVVLGPAYLAGNCASTGFSARWPWLLIISISAIVINALDLFNRFSDGETRQRYEYAWLFIVCGEYAILP